ncbi:ABC transporter ATP-binding protein [Salinicoccus sp. CNSTN-B1]
MNGGEDMLKVSHLSKSFGDVKAVDDVSFHVDKGSTFAFLGTNGAGKSTVIHMIIDLLKPDAGEIIFAGGMLQAGTGVVFQTHRLDEALSLEDNLLIRAELYGISRKEATRRIEELMKLTNIFEKRHRIYGTCSGGERRKVDIIRALLHQPQLLILDEPTTGLDAESREEIWTLFKKLQSDHGLTLFLTTHYIEEAEQADHVLIMHNGKVEIEGTPDALKSQYAKPILKLKVVEPQQVKEILDTYSYRYECVGSSVRVEIKDSKDAIPILQHVEHYISGFSIEASSLEKVFLEVTKQIKAR